MFLVFLANGLVSAAAIADAPPAVTQVQESLGHSVEKRFGLWGVSQPPSRRAIPRSLGRGESRIFTLFSGAKVIRATSEIAPNPEIAILIGL